MTTEIGYASTTMDMTVEQQKNVLKEKVGDLIALEEDKRKFTLQVLPDVLERGSTVYVANLSVLGDRAYRINDLLEKFKKKGVRLVSIKEGIDFSNENDWSLSFKRIGEIEKNASFSKEVPMALKERKGGRKKMEVTPEMIEVLAQYKSGTLRITEVREKLGIGTTTIYNLLKREEKEIDKYLDKLMVARAMELHEWLRKRFIMGRKAYDEDVCCGSKPFSTKSSAEGLCC